jgi:DNA-binding NarL/FixJ family response regulator
MMVCSLSVLIVDDHVGFLDAARRLLRTEGLTVVDVATSRGEALQKITALAPDVVLLDITLGDESGFAVAQEVISAARPGNIAVILMSAGTKSDYVHLMSESSAAGFVEKAHLSANVICEILGRGEA